MEISLKDLLELAKNSCVSTDRPSLTGRAFFFRTVTYHIVGQVEEQKGNFLRLKDAAWIADSGRFADAITKGTLNEVEPVGDAWINLDSVTDFFPWNHSLPLLDPFR